MVNEDPLREVRFRRAILESLLLLASNWGQEKLPSEWEFITSEILGAVWEYLTGEEFRHEYLTHRGPGNYHWVDIVNSGKRAKALF